MASDMKVSGLRDIAFMDNLLEVLTAKILEYYPEIFESDPKYIKAVESVLVRNIMKIGSDLDALSFNAEKDEE